MAIYDINFSTVWEKLTPPILRQIKTLAWGTVLLKPLQWLRDLFFIDYADGSSAEFYDSLISYIVDDKVYYTDRAVYICIAPSTGNLPTDTTYWRKILDNHIGARERVRYNSQKILFEHALNRWFNVYAPDPLIYITNNTVSASPFLLGQTGQTSSNVSRSSIYSQYYLGNSPSYASNTFTIFVPLAVFNALAGNNTDRENIIRNFADRFVLSGMIYDVQTY
jgi:hypothetical protein